MLTIRDVDRHVTGRVEYLQKRHYEIIFTTLQNSDFSSEVTRAPAASESDAAFVRFWKLDDRSMGKLCDRCASIASPFIGDEFVTSSVEMSLRASLMSPLLTELQSSKLKQNQKNNHFSDITKMKD